MLSSVYQIVFQQLLLLTTAAAGTGETTGYAARSASPGDLLRTDTTGVEG